MSIPKNTAGSEESIVFYDLTTGAPVTGGTPTGVRRIDGGAQAPVTGTYAHLGSGHWVWTRSAADTNGDSVNGVHLLAGAYAVPFNFSTDDADLDLIADAVTEVLDAEIQDGIEGTVAASPTPTATAFKVEDLSNTSTAFGNQFTEFLDGPLDGVAKPNASFAVINGTSGTVTLAVALPSAPAAGARCRIIGYRGEDA